MRPGPAIQRRRPGLVREPRPAEISPARRPGNQREAALSPREPRAGGRGPDGLLPPSTPIFPSPCVGPSRGARSISELTDDEQAAIASIPVVSGGQDQKAERSKQTAPVPESHRGVWGSSARTPQKLHRDAPTCEMVQRRRDSQAESFGVADSKPASLVSPPPSRQAGACSAIDPYNALWCR